MGKMKDKVTDQDVTEHPPSAVEISAETLVGDIRDAVLTEFKQMPKPWVMMSEDEQERVIHRSREIADTIVHRAVSIIAEQGFSHLAVTINKYTVKDGVKIEVGAAETLDNITHLAMHSGAAVLVLASISAFDHERAPAEADNVGDLAMPKTGPGAPSDEEGLAHVGRGKPSTNGSHASA